jgi:hypothetical protein
MNSMRDAVVGWLAFAALVAFALAMVSHLRLWSVARNVERIAEALEGMSSRNHGHHDELNGVREYLE